jgi:hypothetical protein
MYSYSLERRARESEKTGASQAAAAHQTEKKEEKLDMGANLHQDKIVGGWPQPIGSVYRAGTGQMEERARLRCLTIWTPDQSKQKLTTLRTEWCMLFLRAGVTETLRLTLHEQTIILNKSNGKRDYDL